MREHLFRGKHKKGFWCYGNLVVNIEGTAIITPDETVIGKYGAVIPETVGEYTGLTDKNGKKIFEGDILEFTYDDAKSFHIVQWSYEYAGWATQNIEEKYDAETMDFWDEYRECYEIIGNIHDNPELLKEDNQ